MLPSHLQCPLRICMPAWLFACPLSHPAFACRLALSHAPSSPPPRKAANRSRILRIRISHSHSHSHAHSTILLCRHHPHAHLRAQPHRRITNHRCAASACFCLLLQTASHHRNHQAHSRKPSQLNVTPPIIIIIIIIITHTHTHIATPSVLHCTASAACHRRITQAPCCANTVQSRHAQPRLSLHCTVS